MTPWQDSSKPASWSTFTVPTRVDGLDDVRITPRYYEDLHDIGGCPWTPNRMQIAARIGGCIFDYFTGESVQQDWIEQNAHGVIRFVVEPPNGKAFTVWTPLIPDATDGDLPTYRGTFRTALELICSDPRLDWGGATTSGHSGGLCPCIDPGSALSPDSTGGLGIWRDKCPDCWERENGPDREPYSPRTMAAETHPADHGERCTLIHALYHLDRNGCYSDHARLLEFGRILTTQELRDLHRELSGE